MHSLRTKITLMTICMIVVAVAAVSVLSVVFIRGNEQERSNQLLLLLCETGERNLDFYFDSVQKSVQKVARFVEEELDGLETAQLEAHISRVETYFGEMANRTNGVLTYYYRIDPAISETVKGFWYTNLDGEGFTAHEVTDITRYDTRDTSRLVWFTVPKHTGEAIWLPPYITDNLDVRVISYNMPIYYRTQFVGVVGIEIDYSTMAKQVDSIRLYDNGYAFLSGADGAVYFHPRIDAALLEGERVPENPKSQNTFFRYRYEGVEKQAAWLPLVNGMCLTVSVPVEETEGGWQTLIREIALVSILVLLSLSLFTLYYIGRITKPLKQLTDAAEQANLGNYDFALDYSADDEVGRLTATFRSLGVHMKAHISDLSARANIDGLTGVRNQGAFSAALAALQAQVDGEGARPVFAVGVFDCDNLKAINDRCGHDKGDIYLKTASGLIRRVFSESPVFRIGGDEFAVILQNEAFENREALFSAFEAAAAEICRSTENCWEQVHVARGFAVYDPHNDLRVIDTVRRADKHMYENKRLRKTAVERSI